MGRLSWPVPYGLVQRSGWVTSGQPGGLASWQDKTVRSIDNIILFCCPCHIDPNTGLVFPFFLYCILEVAEVALCTV